MYKELEREMRECSQTERQVGCLAISRSGEDTVEPDRKSERTSELGMGYRAS